MRRPCPVWRALRKQVVYMRMVTSDPNVRNVVDPGLLGLSRETILPPRLQSKDYLAFVDCKDARGKAPLNVALASMRDCPVFKAACAAVAAAALPGVRTPFSREAVQSSLWHGNKSGIYSMLGPQRGPLSHYFAAQELESPRKMSAHVLSANLDSVVREIAAQVKAGSDLQRPSLEKGRADCNGCCFRLTGRLERKAP